MRGLAAIVGAGGLLAMAAPAWAVPLLPGDDVTTASPNPLAAQSTGGTQVATLTLSYGESWGSSVLAGTVTSVVRQGDTANPYGGLSFYYQVSNNGLSANEPVDGITLANFTGFQTDVAFVAGGAAPTSADRSTNGSTIGFDFISSILVGSSVPPGGTSDWLVVHTNAPAWTEGHGGVTNSITDNVGILAPVPEPGALAVLGLVAVAFGIRRRR